MARCYNCDRVEPQYNNEEYGTWVTRTYTRVEKDHKSGELKQIAYTLRLCHWCEETLRGYEARLEYRASPKKE